MPRLEKLAAEFGTRDLVIVESRRSSDLHVLALPLAYAFDNNVLVLSTPRPDRKVFRDFLAWARARYRNVYFVGSGGTDLLSRSIAVVPVSTERFRVPEYESVWNGYPRRAQQKEFDFSIYRFVDPPAGSVPFDLKVGTEDDLYVVRFHAKERPYNQSYRWTTDSSYVTLVGLTERSSTLTLWMDDGGRPLSAGPAVVACFLDNRPIGEVTVTSGIKPYRFAIPPRSGRGGGGSRRAGAAPPRGLSVVAEDRARHRRRPNARRHGPARGGSIGGALFSHLQLNDRRERWLVGLADAGLRRRPAVPPTPRSHRPDRARARRSCCCASNASATC